MIEQPMSIQARDCGECHACCDLSYIEGLKKPNEICKNLIVSDAGSCGDYSNRPRQCCDYECLWKQQTQIPDHFRPDRCGVIYDSVWVEDYAYYGAVEIIEGAHEDPDVFDLSTKIVQSGSSVAIKTISQGIKYLLTDGDDIINLQTKIKESTDQWREHIQ